MLQQTNKINDKYIKPKHVHACDDDDDDDDDDDNITINKEKKQMIIDVAATFPGTANIHVPTLY